MGRCEPTKHQIQAAFFSWARLHDRACLAYAIPNGGHRHVAVAGKLKAEGVRKGVLDVCLPIAAGGAHGLYIEFKSRSGRLSQEQVVEAECLVRDGYTVAVCRQAQQAVGVTLAYLKGELAPALLVL